MAKKTKRYLLSLSKSTSIYAKEFTGTESRNTFNLPAISKTIPSVKPRGKTLKDFSPVAAAAGAGGCTGTPDPKLIFIQSGEYVHGSVGLGASTADLYRSGERFPSVINISRYASDYINFAQTGTNPSYTATSSSSQAANGGYPAWDHVTGVEDKGGTYVDSSGATLSISAASANLVYWTGNNASPIPPYVATDLYGTGQNLHSIVYPGDNLPKFASKREIEITFASGDVITVNVLIPGWMNNTGLGQSLVDNFPSASNVRSLIPSSISTCSTINPSPLNYDINFSTHAAGSVGYANAGSSPLFTGYGAAGAGAGAGLYNLNVTRVGPLHDNTGLISEGFGLDDDGNGHTSTGNALPHQQVWPQGLFYKDMQTLDERHMFMLSGNSSLYQASGGDLKMSELWNEQYANSALTGITHTNPGTVLVADSVQHYEVIQSYLLNDSVNSSGRQYNTQTENTQANFSVFQAANTISTNTSDDSGAMFSTIEGQMMSANGDIWNRQGNSYTQYNGAYGNGLGFLGAPTDPNLAVTFQTVQIYSKDLFCTCTPSAPPVTSIPIALCADSHSPEYYLYTGKTCGGLPVPSDLMNGTATVGVAGCTNCDYENTGIYVDANTNQNVACSCACSKPTSPVIDIAATDASVVDPSIFGGTDGSFSIFVEQANSNADWEYLVEPVTNISAGLGIGQIDTSTLSSSLFSTSGSNQSMSAANATQASGVVGTGAILECFVDNGLGTVYYSFRNRGSGYNSGDLVRFENSNSDFIVINVSVVVGVSVRITGDNNVGSHHSVNTPSGGIIATLGNNIALEHVSGTTNHYSDSPNFFYLPQNLTGSVPGHPYHIANFFYGSGTSNSSTLTLTGAEAGLFKVTVFDSGNVTNDEIGCFDQYTVELLAGPVNTTNGCTDNNAGTNDGAALNFDANAVIDNSSCVYCRAVDGKLVNYISSPVNVVGTSNPGDIFTSSNNSTAIAATTSIAADGSISYSRQLNSVFAYYASLIQDVNNNGNATFKMEVYKLSGSAQTLTGATQVNSTQSNSAGTGFNFDFSPTNWATGLTYGYYGIKSYVDDPDSASEQEQCFQVDYFTVPVLACLIGPAGMQVGITSDGETITDPALIVGTIPSNPSLNACAAQCCDDPILTTYDVPDPGSNGTPGCNLPAFSVEQTCPNGVQANLTTAAHNIQFYNTSTNAWDTILTESVSTAGWFNATFTTNYNVNIYNAYGPGDYRVETILNSTFPGNLTTQCIALSNAVSLNTQSCGCTDATALNYDPLAVIDDGSCIACVNGCMDPNSNNFNSIATCDNGTCTYCVWGCMDAAANNYNPLATCDVGCNFGVGCGCTNILASNFGYDCSGNAVGFPPTCDDGCCEGLCANAPVITTPILTTKATCGCVQPAGCNSSLTGTSGGPGYFIIDLDFGTDKGVAVFTFNTSRRSESVPDKLVTDFDGVSRSEYSSLVGGYLSGLIGSSDDPNDTLCTDCDQSGFLTAAKDIYEFELNVTNGNFVSTLTTKSVGPYGGNSTGDVTLSRWAVGGATIPHVGQTPNYPTTFNEDGYFNRNSVSYISVPQSTATTTAKLYVEAPCDGTWWGVTLACPEILAGMGGSVAASYGAPNSTVDALSITTTYFHIPIDQAGAGNPNSSYATATGLGVAQLPGTLGKHDWIFSDAYGVTRLAAGNYKIESPAGSGTFWNVTVGVPSYNNDVSDTVPPQGPIKDGVVLKMEGPL